MYIERIYNHMADTVVNHFQDNQSGVVVGPYHVLIRCWCQVTITGGGTL